MLNLSLMKADKTTVKEDELMELGESLQRFYELGYTNEKEALKFSFLKGIAQGFGIFIGGTVVVAVVLWLLGSFTELPLIGPASEAIKRTTGN